MSRRILIAGCGDVGTRLGRRLAARGDQVWGLCRNPGRLPDEINPQAGNLLEPGSLANLPEQWDALVYSAAPGARSEAGYRDIFLSGQRNLASRVSARRTLFVSSTAVYGQDDGEWVDEASETQPTGFNGRILLEAEHLARELWEESVVVRFGGIYGPGRDRLIRSVRSGPTEVQSEPPHWTNRIHGDDCAAMLEFLLDMETPRPVWAGVDRCPAPRFEVLQWIAERLEVPGPVPVSRPGAGSSKRVRSDRVVEAGFRFAYPDYRAGYGSMIGGA
ncbi:MAG: SDR family oxidoreductase [Xanthomonadales bacterium]|nr:SDR family oxidoreductase [Xanthomonadales bacterium]